MTERWEEAVWLGKRWHNDEHWCFNLSDKCMYSARSIRLQHDGEQWNFEKINLVCCTPWKLNGDKLEVAVPGVIPFTETETVDAMPKVSVCMPRDFKITEDIIKKVGYSEGCLKCGAVQRGIDGERTGCRRARCCGGSAGGSARAAADDMPAWLLRSPLWLRLSGNDPEQNSTFELVDGIRELLASGGGGGEVGCRTELGRRAPAGQRSFGN